jgi:hypothetical protein
LPEGVFGIGSPSLNTVVLIACCAVPLIGLFVFLGASQRRKERQAFDEFAALLDGGKVIEGSFKKGRRAVGRWKGVEVSVAFFGRIQPPVFLTAVSAVRRPSPFVALFVPRERGYVQEEPPKDTPPWLAPLDNAYNAGCAPRELFRTVMDEETAAVLCGFANTEVEVLPNAVTVQRREVLHDGGQIVPLLDAAVQLARRLDGLHDLLVGPTEQEASRRMVEVQEFLNSFRR